MTNNIFVNWVKNSHIYTKTTADGKRTFKTVSLPCKESVSGWASLSVNNGQVYASKSEGFSNILLGAPDKQIKLSIFDGNGYSTIVKTAQEVAEMVKAGRQDYKATAQAQAQ